MNNTTTEIHTNPILQFEKDLLLCHVKKISKVELYKATDITLTEKESKRLKKLIKKRKDGVPLAYITNVKEFYGRDFYVDNNVLIPRPETELIIEEVLKVVRKNVPIRIFDIGTGSGNIAVTLAKELESATVVATDIDKYALTLAKKNALIHKVNDRIAFMKSDLLKKVHGNADILIANLPYLPECDDANVLRERGILFEPKRALFAGIDGLTLYKKLIMQIKLHSFKKTYFEIDPTQSFEIARLVTNNLRVKKIEIKKDLAGHDRLVIVTL